MAEEKLVRQFGRGEGRKIAGDLRSAAGVLAKEPGRMAEVLRNFPRLMTSYSFCTAEIENEGHPFGEDLSDGDKDALIAFLATL
jgi:hypothetical protein